MAQSRDTSWLDELFDFFVELPWWVGPPCVFALYALARWGFPWLSTIMMGSDELGEGTASTLTMLSIRLAPLVGGVMLVVGIAALVIKVVQQATAANRPTGAESASHESVAAPLQTTEAPAPTCPECGAAMVRRVAKTGQFKGQPFFGCSRFPECRGMQRV